MYTVVHYTKKLHIIYCASCTVSIVSISAKVWVTNRPISSDESIFFSSDEWSIIIGVEWASDESPCTRGGSTESLHDHDAQGVIKQRRSKHKPAESSFTSVESFTSLNEEKMQDLLDVQLKSYGNLPTRTSLWNDALARKVYASFKVKRFIIENNYIWNPLDNAPSRNIKNILRLSDKYQSAGVKWSDLEKKLESILQLYPDSAADFAYCLHDEQSVKKHVSDWQSHMMLLTGNMRKHQPPELLQTKNYLDRFLSKLAGMGAHKIPEYVFESYLEFLFNTLCLLWPMASMNFRLTHVSLEQISFTTPSLGELVCPKPDYYLVSSEMDLLAVVEVKPCQLCKCHKGRRISSKKDPVDEEKPPEDSPLDGLPALLEGLPDGTFDESLEKSGKELSDGEANDQFDMVESARDHVQTQSLPPFLRQLDLTDKKQVRCFLPQLIGQLLASHSVGSFPSFSTPYEPIRLGFGLVGVKLRIVTMVLKDQARKIKFPTAADVEKVPSVRPYIYLTRELNLFKKDHLVIFFQMLFALRTLTLLK